VELHRPGKDVDDPALVLVGLLDFYREVVIAKLDGLGPDELTGSRLPSGWSPVELLKHLVYMERRWLVWGFLAEQVPDPWGDEDPDAPDDGWRVEPGEDVAGLRDRLREGGRRTREIVTGRSLTERAAIGGRFSGDAEPPALSWILAHVLQEYARHTGHLDIVRELIDGSTGEDG
jgi:uncharacterized damage-inducible protein DinB